MPIKGITDRYRLPRLGKIHLGIKATSAKGVEYPRAVDYFVCPEVVQGVYGEQPRELDIMFPVDDDEAVASQYYRAYSASRGLVCKGDGETADQMVDADILDATGEAVLVNKDTQRVQRDEVPCMGRDCPHYEKAMCRELMTLQFLLPNVPGLGIWQIDTSSWNSITHVNSALQMLRATAGRIHSIPLKLVLIPVEVTADGKKKSVHVLDVTLPPITFAELQRQVKALGPGSNMALPEPDAERPGLIYDAAQMQAQGTYPEEAEKPKPVFDRDGLLKWCRDNAVVPKAVTSVLANPRAYVETEGNTMEQLYEYLKGKLKPTATKEAVKDTSKKSKPGASSSATPETVKEAQAPKAMKLDMPAFDIWCSEHMLTKIDLRGLVPTWQTWLEDNPGKVQADLYHVIESAIEFNKLNPPAKGERPLEGQGALKV